MASIINADTSDGLKITSDTSGQIDFQSAGSTKATIDTAGNLKFDSGYGSVATGYGCRAWVNFNGTSTVAIRDSGNVSSVTDNGTGDYTINFAIAMPDANYSSSLATTTYTAGNDVIHAHILGTSTGGATTQTTTQLRFTTGNTSSATVKFDMALICASIFR